MRFTYGSQVYSISFNRYVPKGRKRVRTMAVLFTEPPGVSATPTKDWQEVDNAIVTHHTTDVFSKELGRRYALKALAKKLLDKDAAQKPLIGKMLATYYSRPRPKDINALKRQIAHIQAEIVTLEGRWVDAHEPKTYVM